MATGDFRPIPAGVGMIGYNLSPTGKKKGEPAGERVQFVHSTFVASVSPDGIASELKLASGRTADAYHLRVSFSPEDRKLNKEEFKSFTEKIAAEMLGDRPFHAVCHDDTAHQHIHIVSSFLDSQGRVINFRKSAALKIGEKRQSAIDRLCSEFGMSVIPREHGKVRRAQDRRPLAAIREAERTGKGIWLDELKQYISAAEAAAESIPLFIRECGRHGVEARLRGQGISFSFLDQNGKKRICRGKSLGQRWTLQAISQRINNQREVSMESKEQEVMERGKEIAEQAAAEIWERNQDVAVAPAGHMDKEDEARRIAGEIGKIPRSKKEVKKTFESARGEGVDLAKIASVINPATIMEAGNGNPVPLILSLTRGIGAAIHAAVALKGIAQSAEAADKAHDESVQAVCFLWQARDLKMSPEEKAIRIKHEMETKRFSDADVTKIFYNAEKHGCDLNKIVTAAPREGIDDHAILSLSRKLGTEIKLAKAAVEIDWKKPGLTVAQGRESLTPGKGRKPAPLEATHITPKGPGGR